MRLGCKNIWKHSIPLSLTHELPFFRDSLEKILHPVSSFVVVVSSIQPEQTRY